MKKKLITAAAILLVLLFAFIGFLQYRQYSSYKIPIHANAQTIIRINTDKFIKSFIEEYGINFKKKIAGKNDSLKNTGIYFPGNIFVYNVSSKSASTFFCTLPMYDVNDFTSFIKKRFNIQLTESTHFRTGTNADSSITIACTQKYISIAYSTKKEEVLGILNEILAGTNVLASNNELLSKLKKQRTHIAIANSQWIATMDLADNSVLLHATIDSFNNLKIPEECKQLVPGTKSIASFSLSAFPLASLFKKQYSIKDYSIETDSILQYFNGYSGIELGPTITQKDTITTYEYDDNFEKVEKRIITDVKVPSINFVLNVHPGMMHYLQKKQIVSANNTLNKTVFPLYNVFVQQSKQLLLFSTDAQKIFFSDSLISTENFLDLKIDFKKDSAALELFYLQSYTKNISEVFITGKRNIENNLILNGEIKFTRNIIAEIMEILKMR